MGSMPVINLVFPDNIQHSILRLFADDNIIYKQIKNKEDAIKLQQDLDAAGKWEQDWLMPLPPRQMYSSKYNTKAESNLAYISIALDM
jgi:hypothetical protein